MPFSAPVLSISNGMMEGIMSGENALNSAIDYVRDQYKNQKAAQGAMQALSSMKDGSGNPMIPPAVLDQFNKMSPQGQVAAAGMFSQRASNLWDAQNKIAVAQASAQAEGGQQRQTNAAQFQNIRSAWQNGNPTSADLGKANSGVVGGNNPAVSTPQQPQQPNGAQKSQGPVTYQMPLNPKNGKSGFYSFQVDPTTGKPIPGTISFAGTSAVPNTPLFQQPNGNSSTSTGSGQ
jgi:hypothetical protein